MKLKHLPSAAAVLGIAIALLTGCSESETLKVFACDDSICFTAPAFSKTNYYVHSGGVSRADCENDCIYWEVLVPNNEDAIRYEDHGSITYGQSLAQTVVTTAPRSLTAGSYNASFNIGYAEQVDGKQGARFSATFTLDSKGKIVTK